VFLAFTPTVERPDTGTLRHRAIILGVYGPLGASKRAQKRCERVVWERGEPPLATVATPSNHCGDMACVSEGVGATL